MSMLFAGILVTLLIGLGTTSYLLIEELSPTSQDTIIFLSLVFMTLSWLAVFITLAVRVATP
jgi:hypothetical protein